jgi:DNA-binding response OmpR family regulator
MNALKILLVDDDEPIRNMYAEIFKKEGFEVSEAINGVDGLEQATKSIPDIVFTGIVMPTMDGFQLMEALKKNVATSNIPVVISSHLGREEDKRKAQELGAKEFLIRGFYPPHEIVEKIRAIFKLAEYKLKLNPTELDAKKLIKDMHFKENFKCSECGGELILSIKLINSNSHEFAAKFVCPGCGVAQK